MALPRRGPRLRRVAGAWAATFGQFHRRWVSPRQGGATTTQIGYLARGRCVRRCWAAVVHHVFTPPAWQAHMATVCWFRRMWVFTTPACPARKPRSFLPSSPIKPLTGLPGSIALIQYTSAQLPTPFTLRCAPPAGQGAAGPPGGRAEQQAHRGGGRRQRRGLC